MPSLAPPRAGEPAPGLTLPSTAGTPVDLADFRGRPLLLLFMRHLG